MTQNPVRWFEIYVKDIDRAKKFYSAVFSVEFKDMSSPDMDYWSFPSNPEAWGSSGALVRMKGLEPSGISTVVYFASEDCAVEEKKVSQAGGKIHKPKVSIGEHGFITLAYDTEGNMFGIHSMK